MKQSNSAAFDLLRVLGVALIALFGLTVHAEPLAGRDYTLISPPQPTETGKNIEVVEAFSYLCPHCFNLDPVLAQWVKRLPKDVTFRRMPVAFRDSWVPLAKAYFAAEALGVTDKLHGEIFNALHVQNLRLTDERILLDWVAKQGVDRQRFADAYASFAVQSKVQRAQQMTRAYGVEGVPALIVDGKYLASVTGTQEEMLKVVDQLIARVRHHERGGKPRNL